MSHETCRSTTHYNVTRADLSAALSRFEAGLDDIVQAGSPVRTTNRSGAGTKGTRLVDGFNEAGLTFALFYDDV